MRAGQPGTVLQRHAAIFVHGPLSVRLDKPGQKHLPQLNRCLKKQPDGVSHLKLFSTLVQVRSIRKLIYLRCAHTVQACRLYAGFAWARPRCGNAPIRKHRVGNSANVAMC